MEGGFGGSFGYPDVNDSSHILPSLDEVHEIQTELKLLSSSTLDDSEEGSRGGSMIESIVLACSVQAL